MGLEITAPTNYRQRQADIKQRLLMAQMLNQNAQDTQQNPNQMVGNRVVPISPFTAIANALSKGFASYQGAKAQTEQGQLDDEKRNYLVKALSGGQQVTPEIIANAGGDVGDILKLAATQGMGRATPGQWYIPPGSTSFKDEETGIIGYKTPEGGIIPSRAALTENQQLTNDPRLQGEIAFERSRNKIGPVVGEDEATRYMTYGAAAGFPDNFEPALDATARVESGGNPNAISPAGAQGTYQIMPETAANPGYGLNPLPPNATEEQKRLFAAEYQLNMLKAHPEWTYGHVASAYNMGPGNVEKGRRNADYERKIMGGVRSPTRQEKDVREIQKDVTKESLLSPVKKDLEGFKTDENIRQKEAEIEAQKLAPLPQAVLKERTDLLDDISTNSSIVADLGTIKNQVDSGNLNLGFFKNLALKGKAYAGSNDPEVLNYNTYVTSLEKLRNDSLRLNKGIQTDSDARRAWDEIMGNPYNSNIVSKRLEEIQNINSRAMEIKKNLVNAIHDNYGKPKYDFSAFENQKPAINQENDGWKIEEIK